MSNFLDSQHSEFEVIHFITHHRGTFIGEGGFTVLVSIDFKGTREVETLRGPSAIATEGINLICEFWFRHMTAVLECVESDGS